ncbi:M43 family zinc metalloprotease [Ahniella affigens]|nr:M43 family zinc metalloprotease [Ahniella affigens]
MRLLVSGFSADPTQRLTPPRPNQALRWIALAFAFASCCANSGTWDKAWPNEPAIEHRDFELRHRWLQAQDAEFQNQVWQLDTKQSPTTFAPNPLPTQSAVDAREPEAAIFRIPVVVHVIHTGQSVGTGVNISDAQIHSAIDNLNAAYSNSDTAWSDYTGVNTLVQFCLAQRDDLNNPSPGIVRVDGSAVFQYTAQGICNATGSCGVDNELAVKSLSAWDSTRYLNVWVVNEINGNDGGAGTQGYAYFPGAPAAQDGLAVLYNAFGYDPDGSLGFNLKPFTSRNATSIHEIAHFLGVYHTYEGDGFGSTCPTDAICGASGDCVADTPRHRRSAMGCIDDATPNVCQVGTTAGDFQHNFMDSSSEVCQSEFTSGQAQRMVSTLLNVGSRILLGASPGCEPVALPDPILVDGFE